MDERRANRIKCIGAAVCIVAAVVIGPKFAAADEFDPRAEFLPEVVRATPSILDSQDPVSGRFGPAEGWTVARQNVLLVLAAAWGAASDDNPYSGDEKVLDAIIAGGDALIAIQDANGRLPFYGSDGADYGRTYLPWTCSRWVRAYAVVRDAMPADAKARWERALSLTFSGIAAELRTSPVQNISAHHAMALYVAGRALDRPQWRAQGAEFLAAVAAAQDEGGFWSEHLGPVVNYGFVYVDALGTYYALSRDHRVLPALQRASRFYANFTYPDGSYVATIDERNPYDLNWFKLPSIGFSFTTEGRGFVRRQLARKQADHQPIDADIAASFVLYGQPGEAAEMAADQDKATCVLGDHDALVHRDGPWFVCLSAYHGPVVASRWIQDRTKLQPLWSTFTVGDTSKLAHRPGETNPSFIPPAGLMHVPTEAELNSERLSLDLVYGEAHCRVSFDLADGKTATLVYSLVRPGSEPAAAHLPFMPKMGAPWETASGQRGTIGEAAIQIEAGEAGEWFAHNGWRVSLPEGATITWPVLPHQPYARDGRASTGEGRILVALNFSDEVRSQQIRIAVP